MPFQFHLQLFLKLSFLSEFINTSLFLVCDWFLSLKAHSHWLNLYCSRMFLVTFLQVLPFSSVLNVSRWYLFCHVFSCHGF